MNFKDYLTKEKQEVNEQISQKGRFHKESFKREYEANQGREGEELIRDHYGDGSEMSPVDGSVVLNAKNGNLTTLEMITASVGRYSLEVRDEKQGLSQLIRFSEKEAKIIKSFL